LFTESADLSRNKGKQAAYQSSRRAVKPPAAFESHGGHHRGSKWS